MEKAKILAIVLVGIGISAIVASSFAGEGPAVGQKYTYADLVNRLIDLEALAALPEVGERCAQFSSHDRQSVHDEASGEYVNWDANGADGNCYIRKEGDRIVLAEMQGPGCIWRIWSAKPENGHVKIFLDGSDEPAVDLPFVGYFDRKNPPFVYPSLVHGVNMGWNSYFPIPYQKSCKIVAEEGWGQFYHFGYETFPQGTQLPTFKRDLSSEEKGALEKVDDFLRTKLGTDPVGRREGEITEVKKVGVRAGGSVEVADIAGPRAITALWVKLKDPERHESIARLLREVTLSITWDGEENPSIWTPLGDFFGTNVGINKYRSLPMGTTDEGFYSFWYMPFSKSARIAVAHDGTQTCDLEFRITHAPLSRPANELGRFHAKWHRDAFLPEEPARKIDWPFLKTEGRGRFCGVMLHVWNPRGGWWGEGDEKFFVDGEKFPSTFGTGSEDYFGFAWASVAPFQHAFHNITHAFWLNTSLNRWHIADNVPFQTSLEASIEKYFPNEQGTLYACVAYWYLAPGGEDAYVPLPVEDRTGYWKEYEIFCEPGALEGENLEVLEITRGGAGYYRLAGWSNAGFLAWTGGRPGDRMTLALPVKETGTYKLQIGFFTTSNQAIIQTYLDERKSGEPVDLFYGEGQKPLTWESPAAYELKEGSHRLTFEITGANEKAWKLYCVGIDWVKLIKSDSE